MAIVQLRRSEMIAQHSQNTTENRKVVVVGCYDDVK